MNFCFNSNNPSLIAEITVEEVSVALKEASVNVAAKRVVSFETSTKNGSTDFEVLRFKVNFEVGQSLGLSVEMTEGSIGVDKKKKKVGMQQVVTRVDSRSPSERAGLKKGDVIMEVNGHSTQGQSNKKVVSWIRNSFRVIEFLVKREVDVSAGEDKENGLNVRDDQGSNEEQLNEEAKRLAAKAILESMNRLMEEKQT